MKQLLWLLFFLPVLSLATVCPKHTDEQKALLQLAYDTGKPHDLGYTLAAIVWREAFVGSYIVRVNGNDGKHGSFGITQVQLTTAMSLTKEDNIWRAKQNLVIRLMTDDLFSLHLSIKKLKKHRHKGFRGMWKAYNGRGPMADKYSEAIAQNVTVLQNCYKFEGEA